MNETNRCTVNFQFLLMAQQLCMIRAVFLLLMMGRKTARNMQSYCAINKNWKFTVHLFVLFISYNHCSQKTLSMSIVKTHLLMLLTETIGVHCEIYTTYIKTTRGKKQIVAVSQKAELALTTGLHRLSTLICIQWGFCAHYGPWKQTKWRSTQAMGATAVLSCVLITYILMRNFIIFQKYVKKR